MADSVMPFGKEHTVPASVLRDKPDLAPFGRLLREQRRGTHAYVMLLGLRPTETPALLAQVEAGFAFEAFERLQRNLDLSTEELARLMQIKPRTLARRREAGRLTPEESDRLLRASRLFGDAIALFEGDVDAARTWLATPAPALADRAPQDVATTEVGAREVEHLIGRLEHGVFS
jgi:putative toxin-antitoxin system antitoxin component (TIGR02293 family)